MNNSSKAIEVVTPAKQFLNQLRQATSTIHEQVEALPLSRSLLSDEVSFRDYQFYLLCMKEVMEVYDRLILPQIKSFLPDADERRKLPALMSDLQFLNEKAGFSPLIQSFSKPIITSEATAMGMAYVIEGSTLGGRVILKHLQEKLDFDSLLGVSFFTGYGEKTGSKWKIFLDALTRYAIEKHQEQQIIDGAVQGFHMVYSHLLKNGKRNEN